jgi:hypothetical protein
LSLLGISERESAVIEHESIVTEPAVSIDAIIAEAELVIEQVELAIVQAKLIIGHVEPIVPKPQATNNELHLIGAIESIVVPDIVEIESAAKPVDTRVELDPFHAFDPSDEFISDHKDDNDFYDYILLDTSSMA